MGPGEYVGDPTEGVRRVEDLPKPRVLLRSRDYRQRPCPRCRRRAFRVKRVERWLHDLGDEVLDRRYDILLRYSQHHCRYCGVYFHAELPVWALPKSHYTLWVVLLAVRLVVEDGLPYRAASWHLWRDHRVFVPFATVQNWVEAGGKKGGGNSGWALS